MKTILHVIDTTGPGGAETVFIDLASKLPIDQYKAIVTIRGKGWVYDELLRRGIQPVLLDAKGSFNWRFLLKLRKLIKQEKVDLIQSHLLGAGIYSALAGFITRTPVVATFHGLVDIGINERFKAIKIGSINLGANKVIGVSKLLMIDILQRTKLKHEKIQVIYNGIDTALFAGKRSIKLREKFGWGNDDFIVGCLGNIRPAKAYNILLDAANIVSNADSKVRFVIAGQPDKENKLYNELLDQRERLGLCDHVQFLGFIDDSVEFLSNLDLFVSSSISEGLPLSAIQAMAAGLPLLATRVGGYEELVTHGKNGWLVEPGQSELLAKAILQLKENEKLRQELADDSQHHVTDVFDVSAMLKSYTAVYDGILTK